MARGGRRSCGGMRFPVAWMRPAFKFACCMRLVCLVNAVQGPVKRVINVGEDSRNELFCGIVVEVRRFFSL